MVSEKKSVKVLGPPAQTTVGPNKSVKNNNNNAGKSGKHAKNNQSVKKPILLLPPPPMPKTPQIAVSKNDQKFLQFVGASCGHHASYVFYKAIKYVKNGQTKILSLGEFFFVKIWPNSDLVAIGELQLLWEDKNTNQTLSSLRLYFLPEYTPEGRMHYHGEDEVVAVSEKAVLRVSDLLDWIASPKEIEWDRGLKGICEADCQPLPGSKELHQYDKGLNAKFAPGHSEFLSDVRREKEAIGDVPDLADLGVMIINSSQYSRYRAVLKRIQGVESNWMHNSLIVSLGGFTTQTRKTHILFCREIFDYAELEEHPYLCNHLAPKLKGRPRKRKKIKRPGSPESESASSESSGSTSVSVSAASTKSTSKNGIKKDLLSILSQKNTKEETEFLKKLITFMECRNTPIERPPMLGYKQIDLHLFFEKVAQLGGYDGCMTKKAWKSIYDDLGGNPQNTSAATCTRRHYEKFLLPYERHSKGLEEQQIKRRESESGSEKSASSVETKPERLKSETLEESGKSPPSPASTPAALEETTPTEAKKKDANEDLTSNKHNPLLDQVKSLIGTTKPESQMKIDPEGKQLQIDDLIIIPNNMSSASTPEGGSALQNLAKIASRYQNQKGPQPASDSLEQPSASKKAKLDQDSLNRQVPTSLAALASMNPLAMTPAQQQSLFAMLQPGLFGMPANKSSSGSVPSNAKMSSLFSPFGLGDPSKLGPEALKLLQMFDSTLKAAVGGPAQAGGQSTPTKSASSPKPRNASGSSTASSPSLQSAKDRDRSKITRLPADAKRPPDLPGHHAPFAQTSNIYTNPYADLDKAKELSLTSNSAEGALDLSSNQRKRPAASGGLQQPPPPPMNFGLNLKKESALKAPQAAPLAAQVKKNEVKVSPFSAEALLSKSSSSSTMGRPPPSMQSALQRPSSGKRDSTPPRSTLASVMFSPASAGVSSGLGSDNKSIRTSSPWHTPVTSNTRSSASVGGTHVTSSGVGSKPAIPVSPVVREDKNKADLSFQAALLGLGNPSASSTSTTSALAAAAAAAAAAGQPPVSLPLPPTSFGSFSANPYLALAAASGAGTKTTSAAASFQAAAAASPFGMDPTAAYYAALYSQSLYGMSPYAAAGMRLPGLPPAPPPHQSAPPPGANAASAAHGMDLMALHAMMNRSSAAAANPAAAAAAAAAAASNPYAAAAAAAGYPPGLSGLLGYPGFPPSSGRKDP